MTWPDGWWRPARVSIAWMARPNTARAADLARYMARSGSPSFPRVIELLELSARHTRPDGAPPPLPPSILSRWQGRARVITGDRDPFLPPSRLRGPARTHLHAEVEVVTEAGHLIPEEQPDQLIALLAGNEPTATG